MLFEVVQKMEDDKDDFSHKRQGDSKKIERPQFCPIGREPRMLPITFARTCSKFKADAHTTASSVSSLPKQACLSCPIGKKMLADEDPKKIVADVAWIPMSELKRLNRERKDSAVALTKDELSKHKDNKKRRLIEFALSRKKQEHVRKAFAEDTHVSPKTFTAKRRQEAFMRKVEHIKETLRSMCVDLTVDQRKELLFACTDIIAFEGMQQTKKKKKAASKAAPKPVNAATPRTQKQKKVAAKGNGKKLTKGVPARCGNISFRNDPRVIDEVRVLKSKGLKHSEIAHKIDISPTTVSRIIHDLKKKALPRQTA